MELKDADFEKIIQLITQRTGIIPRESHKLGIRKFIEKKVDSPSFELWYHSLTNDNNELTKLINGSTVNETYFFREEKQFALLKSKVFPEWQSKNGKTPIKIWSAACSDGSEAYSLALLASSVMQPAEISASDINTEVLQKCKDGIYKTSSLRTGDGDSFLSLLAPYKNDEGNIAFSDKIKGMIKTYQINLSELEKNPFIPRKQNIIFIRNVFIYFSREIRKKILTYISEKCLADDGYIFVSMNEIAQIDSEIIPDSIEKIFDGNVFYFHKKIREL